MDGIPLGTDKVAAVVDGLSPDRLRGVLDAIMTVTVCSRLARAATCSTRTAWPWRGRTTGDASFAIT